MLFHPVQYIRNIYAMKVQTEPASEKTGEWLRAGEIAKRLDLSRSQAYALAAEGLIPGVVRVGRSVRVSRSAFEDWLATMARSRQVPK